MFCISDDLEADIEPNYQLPTVIIKNIIPQIGSDFELNILNSRIIYRLATQKNG